MTGDDDVMCVCVCKDEELSEGVRRCLKWWVHVVGFGGGWSVCVCV